ncbi:hypothetical protein ECDEC12A_5748 [Escherichia coli DEC12A]|uniref:Uncharacterized protein n=1 Tax=Escherichia coli DEC2D TaxID=868141 RepID=A0A828U7D9_ECOLX|nr:hypothetical protein EcB171_5131 [Escherichia coli B171]EFR16906.1 hypothetical protein EC236275_2166 [Escherichia coli 2362-75]EHU04550.1 hypothetical protein ECDEC1B_5269 [Escherichia coli DEC1B]EHU09878.1 hypothetical protein ECDEC1A_2171 [Escherichia coli DEC1A]EHU14259.1 hypothetical protein ECDEC1C_1266 [Escherichia coli DEC1C]EHU29512.1 hypothetical protein ECDEC1E_1463 [Escherichia coli DEC1E]EHU31442.1 hypothetical protein ECDEC1D_5336 [Escherichia coli DEC1D]EHU32128.1 hypotheti
MREYGDDTVHSYVRLKCLYQIWVTQSAIVGSGCGDDVKQAHLDYLN